MYRYEVLNYTRNILPPIIEVLVLPETTIYNECRRVYDFAVFMSSINLHAE